MSVGAGLGLPTSQPLGQQSQDSIPSTDPALAEAAASQVTSASLSGYGALPNPQVVWESVQTGSAPAVAALAQQGSPLFEAALTGAPAGGSIGQLPYGAAPSSVTDPNSSLYSFDSKAYQSTLHDQLEKDQNASWRSFGELPQANFGWMDTVRHGSAAEIKKWQTYLKGSKWYTGAVNGVYDQSFEAAFQNFMIARTLPDALFAGDPNVQSNATMFLQGLGVDVTSMQTQLRDPAMLTQVAQQWMATQGPDAGNGAKSELQQYADAYGQNALPASFQDILHEDPVTTFRNGILSLPGIGLLNDVPLVSGVFHGAVNALTGNFDIGHLLDDPRNVEANKLRDQMTAMDKLTPDEVKNMQPLLDSVAQDSGFLGFMDHWDHVRNQFFLEMGFLFKEGFGSGKWENPFDPMSQANMFGNANADDVAGLAMGAMFGKNWSQDNPIFAGALNFIINTADDPLSYLNIIGDMEKLPVFGQQARGIRTYGRMIGNTEARAAYEGLVGTSARDRMSHATLRMLRTMKQQDKLAGISDGLRMAGVAHHGEDGLNQIALMEKILNEPDEQKALDLWMHGDDKTLGFGYLGASGRTLYNSRAIFQNLGQVKETHRLGRLRMVMGLPEHMSFAISSDPIGAAKNFTDLAHLAGMAPAEIGALTDKFLKTARTDNNALAQVALDIDDAIMAAYKKRYSVTDTQLQEMSGIRKFANKLAPRGGAKQLQQAQDFRQQSSRLGTQRGGGELRDERRVFQPEPTARTEGEAVERSLGARVRADEKDPVRRIVQRRMLQLQERLDNAIAINAPADLIAQIQEDLNVVSRPVPFLTTQLLDNFEFSHSPFEMVVAAHPALLASEWAQSKIRADALVGIWKRWTIARISSAIRLDLGDDVIRPWALMMNMGHPVMANKYLVGQIFRTMGVLAPGGLAGGVIGGAVGGLAGLAVGGAPGGLAGAAGLGTLLAKKNYREKVLANTIRNIGSNPDNERMLQTIAKAFNENSMRDFRPALPTSVGYASDLWQTMDRHWTKDPLVLEWIKHYDENNPYAARTALNDLVTRSLGRKPRARKGSVSRERAGSIHPLIRAWAEAQGADLGKKDLEWVVDRWHSIAQELFAHPDLRRMILAGKADREELANLVKYEATLPDTKLPTISARQENPFAQSVAENILNKYPHMIFERIVKAMVDNARANGFTNVKTLYEAQIRKFFAEDPRYGTDAFEKLIDKESTARAVDWIENNTYQGARSVLGGSLRNVFPFYGAAVNMDRFYWRQAAAKPWFGVAALEAAKASQQAQAPTQQPSPGMTGFEGLLAQLGFGAGEGVQFNPLHAFFLTSDGIGSMVPSTGAWFAPVWNAISGNHDLANILSEIPGVGSQIDYATGQASPIFPWLGDLLSGAYMEATGQNAPTLGLLGANFNESQDRLKTLEIEKERQMERDKSGSGPDGTVTDADRDKVTREVGRDLMLTGALQYTLPVSPSVIDVAGQRIAQQMDTWRQSSSDTEKDQVVATQLGISLKQWQAALTQQPDAPSVAQLVARSPENAAALMAYEDHRISSEDRDAIAQVAPWVVSGATSGYQYSTSQTPTDLAQWNLMRQMGQVQVLEPFGSANSFTQRVKDERDVNRGWLEYDKLKNLEYQMIVSNGWTTSSSAYTAWKAAVFDPAVIHIGTNNPGWWKYFGSGGGGTSAPDLARTTAPLRTLMTWMVMPQHSDYETAQSVLWRNAILFRDQAANALYSLRIAGGAKAEQDMILQQLQQNLQFLAAKDPNFAAQLGQYRFGTWMDVVNLEVDEMLSNVYAGQLSGGTGVAA